MVLSIVLQPLLYMSSLTCSYIYNRCSTPDLQHILSSTPAFAPICHLLLCHHSSYCSLFNTPTTIPPQYLFFNPCCPIALSTACFYNSISVQCPHPPISSLSTRCNSCCPPFNPSRYSLQDNIVTLDFSHCLIQHCLCMQYVT